MSVRIKSNRHWDYVLDFEIDETEIEGRTPEKMIYSISLFIDSIHQRRININ